MAKIGSKGSQKNRDGKDTKICFNINLMIADKLMNRAGIILVFEKIYEIQSKKRWNVSIRVYYLCLKMKSQSH